MGGDVPAVTRPDCIEVGEGPLGRGVFATRAITAGEIVELCPTLEVADDDASGRLRDYVFSSNDDDSVAILPLGYGALYNHSPNANCEHVEHGPGVIAYVATRDVRAGDELTINYGAHWWEGRDEVER